MIKKETKYIIRRILISVCVILLLGFIRSCEVKAENLKIEARNTTLKMYNYAGNQTYSSVSTSTIGGGAYWNMGGQNTSPTMKWISNSAFSINNAKLATFNFVLLMYNQNVTNPEGINTITFNGKSCYYTVEFPTIIQQGATNPSETQPYLYGSAICVLNTNLNFTSGGEIVNIADNGVGKKDIFLSDINIITNTDTQDIINNLNELDSYFVTNNNKLQEIINRVVDVIATTQNNRDLIIQAITGQIGTINSSINNQTQQQHSDAEAQKQSTDNINNSINNSNVDSPNDSISQMEQNLPTNSVISDLLTLPIRMFQNILNAVNGSCSPFSLGSLFGTNLVLPCINIQNYLGSALWGAIDVIFCGIFVLSMRKKFVEIFENITSLKNGGNELE